MSIDTRILAPDTRSLSANDAVRESTPVPSVAPRRIIVNADDWGASVAATDRIFDCIRRGAVSSTSAMVFMADSERAAAIARENAIDAGLHLNLTQPFSAVNVPAQLLLHHDRVAHYLEGGKRGQLIFNPLLTHSFAYVVNAQLQEFERLYGVQPGRIDGHHHAHLCANVQWQNLVPAGTVVRRNFTFFAGEKSWANRAFRSVQDRRLARRHRISEYFFDLQPLDRERLRRIVGFGASGNVEIETHPERPGEYEFLMQGGLHSLGISVEVARAYVLREAGEPGARAEAEEAQPFLPAGKPVNAAHPHICVCICTYKRPQELKRLLLELERQNTDGQFTYSIVVADNDEARSGEAAVIAARSGMSVPVKYCTEPQRGIARARNRVIANAEGDYFALIDDDEFPEPDWLLNLLRTCRAYGVDGVLGPVKRHFEQEPPPWLSRSRLYDRAVHPTGMPVMWRGARTGNALLRREVFAGGEAPFRVEFTAGEDQDFFRRRMEEGRCFVWSSDAVVYEVLPPARWKRKYFVRKAFLHGSFAALQPDCGWTSIAKSIVAVPLYTLGLPFALAAGQHRFMTLLVKLCEHTGKLLSVLHIRPIHDEYVSD